MSRSSNGSRWSVSVLKRRGWTKALIRDLLPEPRSVWRDGRRVLVWEKPVILEGERTLRFQEEHQKPEERLPGEAVPHPAPRAASALAVSWNGQFPELTVSTQSTELTGSMQATEPSNSTQSTELSGSMQSTELTDSAQTTELSGSPELSDSVQSPESPDSAQSTEPSDIPIAVDPSIVRHLAELCHGVILSRLRSGQGVRRFRTGQAGSALGEFLALEKQDDGRRFRDALTGLIRSGKWLERNPNAPLCQRVIRDYPRLLLAGAEQAVREFAAAQPEALRTGFLNEPDFPAEALLKDALGTVWSVWYVPRAIRTSLSLLVALNPRDEYPEARAMRRHFVLHLGGTNTGKTYAGFQRLIRAPTGVYLGPLRLLALEAQETLLDAGVECGLTTGEEEDLREEDTHVAATAEKLNLHRRYDVAVIDECQMIADHKRGYAWTRAILGVLAPEVHLCAAPQAQNLLIRLIESCGDSYEIEQHRRQTPLLCMARTVDFDHIQPGDALITFTKAGVLSVAEDLRQTGREPAIIYGALPYATRRKQMEGFLSGKMEYVVATDAIGMGLNLPIRRIIFLDTRKYDGIEQRDLKPEEIQQIAGRAGRYGMYDKGYVGATANLAAVRAGLEAVIPPLQYAVTGFSDLVLQVDFDLLEVLTEWNKMPTAEPYVKLDITRYLTIISKMREMGFLLTREEELRAANIPFDETEEGLRELFFEYLRQYQAGEEVEQPGLAAGDSPSLPDLEQYYRKLDLYFSFCRTFGLPIDEDRLYETRSQVAEDINEILLHNLRNNIRFCAACGRPLPLHLAWKLCASCFQKQKHGRARFYGGADE